LINKNNCFTCHQVDSELIGPPFLKIAEKYKNGLASEHNLAHSIMEGSVGKWGDIPMPPQVALSETEAIQITEYILSLAHPETEQKKLPIQGSYITKAYERVNKVVGDGDNEGRLDNAFKVPY